MAAIAADDAGRPDLLVAADYDPGLRYLCLTAFDAGRALAPVSWIS